MKQSRRKAFFPNLTDHLLQQNLSGAQLPKGGMPRPGDQPVGIDRM